MPASKRGDKLRKINESWLRGIAGDYPKLAAGFWLLRATGPASVRSDRIGPAGPRGADLTDSPGALLRGQGPHDSLMMEIIGWQRGWYLSEHTHIYI